MPEKEDEFELIPISPIRKLEKRIDELESSKFDEKDFYKELVDIIRLNQEIVQEMAKSNDALRIEISKLPGRIESLITKMEELISFVKASATEEIGAPSASGAGGEGSLSEKLNQLIEIDKKISQDNQLLVSSLENLERKLKRPVPSMPPLRKPLLLSKPI